MSWIKLRHRLEYVVFRLLVCIVQAMSLRAAARIAEGLAFIVHGVLPRRWTRYDTAAENLRLSFGETLSEREIDDIIGRMWIHLFRLVVELIQSPRKLHLNNYWQVIEYRNLSASVQVLASGRPVMMLGGHYGNWEMGVSIFGLWGFPMAVVARGLDNPHLNKWFRQTREATGHRMLLKKGNYDELLAMLQRGGMVALLGDQDAGPRGLFVDFFGRPASTFKSIALLALEYKALICVGYARRLEDDFLRYPWARYELGCEDVIDPLEITGDDPVREITERYTRALERAVRRSPEQYFWVHRRWKSEPRQRRQPAAEPRKVG